MTEQKFPYTMHHSAEFPYDKKWMAEFVYDVVEDEQKHGYIEVENLEMKEYEDYIAVVWDTKHGLPEELCWRCENLCREKDTCKDFIGTEFEREFPAAECEKFVERKS